MGLAIVACAGETPTDTTQALAPGDAALARTAKVDICHVRGNGDFHLINVSGNAQEAHLAHGDALPGHAHPTLDGYALSAACEVVPVPDESECLGDPTNLVCQVFCPECGGTDEGFPGF
jgi:hypothetical protein